MFVRRFRMLDVWHESASISYNNKSCTDFITLKVTVYLNKVSCYALVIDFKIKVYANIINLLSYTSNPKIPTDGRVVNLQLQFFISEIRLILIF